MSVGAREKGIHLAVYQNLTHLELCRLYPNDDLSVSVVTELGSDIRSFQSSTRLSFQVGFLSNGVICLYKGDGPKERFEEILLCERDPPIYRRPSTYRTHKKSTKTETLE
jgi:hypothetical protein